MGVGPDEHFAHEVEGDLALAWKTIFQPLLFGVIGAAIKFANLTPATIPRSIMLILIGLCIRLPVAFFACSFGSLNFKEKLFIALSWVPKATVQAALASDPLETILEHKIDEPDFDKWQGFVYFFSTSRARPSHKRPKTYVSIPSLVVS